MTRPRILVVDDDADNCAYAEQVLSERYDIELASSGTAALELTRRSIPALVLLDLGLPGRDGKAVLAALRADPQLPRVPIVACTGNLTADVRAFDAALFKPYWPAKLLAMVESFLGPGAPRNHSADPWDELKLLFRAG